MHSLLRATACSVVTGSRSTSLFIGTYLTASSFEWSKVSNCHVSLAGNPTLLVCIWWSVDPEVMGVV